MRRRSEDRAGVRRRSAMTAKVPSSPKALKLTTANSKGAVVAVELLTYGETNRGSIVGEFELLEGLLEGDHLGAWS